MGQRGGESEREQAGRAQRKSEGASEVEGSKEKQWVSKRWNVMLASFIKDWARVSCGNQATSLDILTEAQTFMIVRERDRYRVPVFVCVSQFRIARIERDNGEFRRSWSSLAMRCVSGCEWGKCGADQAPILPECPSRATPSTGWSDSWDTTRVKCVAYSPQCTYTLGSYVVCSPCSMFYLQRAEHGNPSRHKAETLFRLVRNFKMTSWKNGDMRVIRSLPELGPVSEPVTPDSSV